MKENLKEIGSRIRELRDVCGFTQEELAQELKLDIELYRSYEESGEDIPISVIYEIANKFGVDFTEIVTGIGGKLTTYHVVRAGEGKPINRIPGYKFEDLAFKYRNKIMQPLLVTLDPSDAPAELIVHKGQEFNMVIEGCIALCFDGKEIILNVGDSIYFNSEHPHSQKCIGNKKAQFLTVIAE